MHCPGCGSKISGAQQFCRACGLDLEQVSRFLAAQLLASPRELQGKGQMIEKWGSNLLLGSLGLLYVALCWIIIDQVIIGGGQALAGLALLTILTGIALGSALKGYASSLRKSLNKHEPLRSTGIGSPEDETKLLPDSQVASVSSVTEHTTELLMAEGNRRTKDA
jgi:hypothetical protein